jgi:hypothetical protein
MHIARWDERIRETLTAHHSVASHLVRIRDYKDIKTVPKRLETARTLFIGERNAPSKSSISYYKQNKCNLTPTISLLSTIDTTIFFHVSLIMTSPTLLSLTLPTLVPLNLLWASFLERYDGKASTKETVMLQMKWKPERLRPIWSHWYKNPAK